MQTQQTSVNFERQFSCISQSKEKRSDSKTIAQQIAEFEARGGKITPIAIGVSACAPGEILVSDTMDSIATPRLSAAGKKAAQNKSKKHRTPKPAPNIKGLVILQDAAKILGVSPHTVSTWIQKGALTIEPIQGGSTRAKYIKEASVIALKEKIEREKKEDEKELVNMNQAARLIGVNPATISKHIKNGTLKIEKVNTQGKLTKLIKTAAVLALKDTIKKGKN